MVADWKLKEVEHLAEKFSKSKVIGLVNISNIPSAQFQKMRKNLRNKVEIKVTKNSIMKRALEKANLKEISDKVDGSLGLIFTELNPFELNKILEENKSYAALKPGAIAPYDIIVKKGDTTFKPGPILGELQKVGIKAQIKSGKIVVTEDSLVAKKNDIITQDLANILPRLGILPVEIALDLKAAYEKGVLYKKEVLKITTDSIISMMRDALKNALNLALNSEFYTKETIKMFIQNAHFQAYNLALNAEIPTKETISTLLKKANFNALNLSSKIPKVAEETKTI